MHPSANACIFHVCTLSAARAIVRQGSYEAASLRLEGFIHLSQAHQVRGVIDRYYAGQPDLVLLVVDPARLQVPLRFEPALLPSTGVAAAAPTGGLFPHLYGPFNSDAVLRVIDARGFDGTAVYPERDSGPVP